MPVHYHVASQPLAIEFSGEAVVNARILGLAVATFGALGVRRVSYAGVALSVATSLTLASCSIQRWY